MRNLVSFMKKNNFFLKVGLNLKNYFFYLLPDNAEILYTIPYNVPKYDVLKKNVILIFFNNDFHIYAFVSLKMAFLAKLEVTVVL